MNDFTSKVYYLGDNYFKNTFNIPIYQRLYVWGDSQVLTLINDLISAYKFNKDDIYYLGGIVVVNNQNMFDLIDGQQRFTTLKILREVLEDNIKQTLTFEIRGDVWDEYNREEIEDENTDIDIKKMKNARELLKNKLKQEPEINNSDFLKFLKERVCLVVTTVPEEEDLNKLFELINGRGEQLQQHEILKAKILSNISNDTKRFGKIWDVCADMDEFLDVNIKKSFSLTWKEYFRKFHNKDLNIIFDDGDDSHEEFNKLSISNILVDPSSYVTDVKNDNTDDEDGTIYQSIISFPLFLLYSLVTFKRVNYTDKIKQTKGRIEFTDKNLIEIFKIILLDESDESIFQDFINHLFIFRRYFDQWIIKNENIENDKTNETEHHIFSVKKREYGQDTNREILKLSDARDLELLQSMLYHSHTRNTQEWIIALFRNINHTSTPKEVMEELMKIDDYLYLNPRNEKTILEKSYNYFHNDYISNNESTKKEMKNKIEDVGSVDYHRFSHYIFYKVDWIIYFLVQNNRILDDALLKELKKDIKVFKFTARNSIEHISPQNPDDENIDEDKVKKYLHSFANLTLISISQNSELGRKGFSSKIAHFKDKKLNNLKMSIIYHKTGNWGDMVAKRHLSHCLSLIDAYYNNMDVEEFNYKMIN